MNKFITAFILLLLFTSSILAKPKEKIVIDSSYTQMLRLEESNKRLIENNLKLKEGVDSLKQSLINNTIREYQITNDRVNNYVTWVSIIAGLFGFIIALVGVWIAYLSYRTQKKSEKDLKIIEDAKGYAEKKKTELDALVLRMKEDNSTDYKKMIELIKDGILNDINTTVKSIKDLSEQKTQEIQAISTQTEQVEIKRIDKKIEFLETLGLTDDPKVLFSKAKILFEEKKYDEVIEVLQKVLKKDQNNGEAFCLLAYSQAEKKLNDLAIENYKKSIALNYFISGSYNNIGAIYSSLKNDTEAIIMYDKALQNDEKHWMSYRNKGVSLVKLNREKEAIDCFNKTIEINPQDKAAYSELISLYKKLNNSDTVISIMDLSITNIVDSSNELNFKKASYLNEINRYSEAINILDNLIIRGYSISNCKFLLASIYSKISDYQKVDEVIESIISMDTKNDSNYLKAINILKLQGAKKMVEFAQKHKMNITTKAAFQLIGRSVAELNECQLAKEFYKDANEIIKLTLDKHSEVDILEYLEGLLILDQLEIAEEFINDNQRYITNNGSVLIIEFLSCSLKRFKKTIDDDTFIKEITKIVPDSELKWDFSDINNYLHYILLLPAYTKMLEIQSKMKKDIQ